MCKMQFENNRFVTFGHPIGAKPWVTHIAKDILTLPKVMIVDFDLCCYNFTSNNYKRKSCVKTRTKVMTNSLSSPKKLMKSQCQHHHEHIPFTNCKANPCQKYTNEFCDEICSTVNEKLPKKKTKKIVQFNC